MRIVTTTRCPSCGTPTNGIFCSPKCYEKHAATDRVLLEVETELAESINRFAREAGEEVCSVWDRSIDRALDEVRAP